MLGTARSRYQLAVALWAVAAAWIALGPEIHGVPPLFVGLAVAATVCAAIVERDERHQQTIRLAWWACTAVRVDDAGPRVPRQEGFRGRTDALGDRT